MFNPEKSISEASVEGGADIAGGGYERYQALGGIINEQDYASALARAKEAAAVDKTQMAQVEVMARVAGIELKTEGAVDPRAVLYGILRSDRNTSGAKYHHSQMGDQRLFVEALRMLGDEESLKKFIESHPHISFDYKKE